MSARVGSTSKLDVREKLLKMPFFRQVICLSILRIAFVGTSTLPVMKLEMHITIDNNCWFTPLIVWTEELSSVLGRKFWCFLLWFRMVSKGRTQRMFWGCNSSFSFVQFCIVKFNDSFILLQWVKWSKRSICPFPWVCKRRGIQVIIVSFCGWLRIEIFFANLTAW